MNIQPQQEVEVLRERVRACRGSFEELSLRSGMSRSWLSKFACGRYQSPRYQTVRALAAALDELQRSAA